MLNLERVLIVDDNPHDLAFLTRAFAASGEMDISGETSSISALGRIRSEKPGLVVLDIKMPELDGFGLLATLRGEGNAVPVVMCSGSALQRDVDRAFSAGCNGYVEKPTSLDDYRLMAETIAGYWRRAKLPSSGA